MPTMLCGSTHSYDVDLVTGVLDPAGSALADAVGSERGLLVVDAGFASWHGAEFRRYARLRLPGFTLLEIGCEEHVKTLATVQQICAVAQEAGLARRDPIVAIGGGICSDLVSVAAGLVRRGTPYVVVPTTLLGQVDAGIALKGGVNFEGHKNYLGGFWPPVRVLVDPGLLRTVPGDDLRSGMAEILKIALVRDADLLRDLRAHGPELVASGFVAPAAEGERLIGRAIALMLEELARDPFERGDLRRLVDFGHTFGGYLEERTDYALRHGEGVAIDMALSSCIAVELGLLSEEHLEQILGTLRDLGLPLWSPEIDEELLRASLEGTIAHRDGRLNLVVPTGPGAATFLERPEDLPAEVVSAAARRLADLGDLGDTGESLGAVAS